MPRWWGGGRKPYNGRRNWKQYSEELVIRGAFFLDLDFAKQWDHVLGKIEWALTQGAILDISGLEYADLGTGCTGSKTDDAGTYPITKYGDPYAHRRHRSHLLNGAILMKRFIDSY